MANTKDFMYKGRDAGHKEFFSMLIYRPIANFVLNKLVRHMKVTPNQISLFSLLMVFVGCVVFVKNPYPYSLVFVIFLHLGYLFDVLDGQYARYKGLESKYGQWFDAFLDTIKGALIFVSLSYKAYLIDHEPMVLLWGMVALIQSFLAFYALNSKEQVIEGSFSIKLKRKVYVGYEASLYWAISLVVISNRLYYGLLFLGAVCAVTWLRVCVVLSRNCRVNKKMIKDENG